VRVRLLVRLERVEAIGDHTGELGMRQIDARIDHGDQHLLALGEMMGLTQPKLS
jgi:hypothetical protein